MICKCWGAYHASDVLNKGCEVVIYATHVLSVVPLVNDVRGDMDEQFLFTSTIDVLAGPSTI